MTDKREIELRRVTGIHDVTLSTNQPLVWVIHGCSIMHEEFCLLAVFTKREDVEAFAIDDPDLVVGSLVAQRMTIPGVVALLEKEAAEGVAARIVEMMLDDPRVRPLLQRLDDAEHSGGLVT